jgi:hypothetical protein
MRLNPFAEQILLSGDVVYYRFVMRMDEYEDEERAWVTMMKERPVMEDMINRTIRDNLGSEFSLRSMTPIRGSIELILVIGTTYYAISKYKNFIDSLELLRTQLESFLKNFFGGRIASGMRISSSMTLGASTAAGNIAGSGTFDANRFLLFYVLLSHAALLAVFIWIVLKRIGTP